MREDGGERERSYAKRLCVTEGERERGRQKEIIQTTSVRDILHFLPVGGLRKAEISLRNERELVKKAERRRKRRGRHTGLAHSSHAY